MARLTWGTALFALAAFASLAAMHGAARAQPLPDPMRPPAALAAPAAPASAAAPEGALELQSVLVGRDRTPAAVISGQLVTLGGRVRDARLVRVSERSAVLRGPQGETTLPLIPPQAAPGARDPSPSTAAETTR